MAATSLPVIEDTGTACAEIVLASSSRSSRPRRSARGPASGLRRSTALPSSRAARCGWKPRSGRGTTITLLLPRSEGVPTRTPPSHRPAGRTGAERNPRQRPAGRRRRQRGRIGRRDAVADRLPGDPGCDAAAGLDALAGGRDCDLVFSDIMLPDGMNGVDLAREIRLRRPGLPVVLTSGYSGAVRAASPVADVRVLSKPYQLSELAAALLAATSSGATQPSPPEAPLR